MTAVDKQDERLPAGVVPRRYALRLTPDLAAATFAGVETVSVQVLEAVDEIAVNVREIAIDSASVAQNDGAALDAVVSIDEQREQAHLRFPRRLEPGDWQLQIAFRGQLNDKLAGFYRSSYRDDAGNEHLIATTQFESTDARRAFPCWDEPAFKAVFSVTLVVDEGLAAVSNAPVVAERPAGAGKKAVEFADTIAMSTYLVAFIVGEFEPSEAVMIGDVPMRVWAVPGKRHLTGFALQAGQHALTYFSDYYGIPYPGAKLDLLAIPDFAAGAMENLGAVTFRETLLLADERTATHAELESVAVVVAHELAHMWFGDLVTMRWWNGIWLNEAFATFMEMLAVDAWKPEWQTWTGFGISRAGALLIDGLHSTRPVEYTVRRPDDAAAMFDVLTYQKGAAVLRMLEQYLGAEVFRRGIRDYLTRHAYGNTETGDLWDALEAASGQPVRRTMDSWILQPGYPIVSVDASEDRSTVMLAQERFLYLGSEGAGAAEAAGLWQVPVILRLAGDGGEAVEQRQLLSESKADLELETRAEWLVANAGGHGFYRVRYAPSLLERLMPRMQSGLSPIERFNLVNDTWAAVLAGYSPLREFLDLTRHFREETDESVWSIILGGFGSLRRTMGAELRPRIAALVRDRVGAAQRRLGWQPADGEDARTRQLRGQLLSVLGTLGEDDDLTAEAERRYQAYLADAGSIDPNLVPALLSILAAHGDAARYDDFWRRHQSAATPQEKERYLYTFAGFSRPELIARTLEATLGNDVRSQDGAFLVRSVMTNSHGKEIAWEFVKQHWQALVARFPENATPRMCEGVVSLTTPELEADVRQFFATHEVKQGARQIDQHLERLRMSVRFRQREEANLEGYQLE